MRRHSLTDEQLNSEIVGSDIPNLANYFDGVVIYSCTMGLKPSELADVEDLSYRKGIQIAMTKCLILWKRHDPVAATYKALLELLLRLSKEEIADQICPHLTKCDNYILYYNHNYSNNYYNVHNAIIIIHNYMFLQVNQLLEQLTRSIYRMTWFCSMISPSEVVHSVQYSEVN